MKRKLFLTFLLTLVVSCLLSIVAFAQSFTVDYSGKATETTDENGTITLKSEAVQDINGDIKTKTFTIKNEKGESVTVSPSFLGWYTDDGAFYLPGEKITLTEDTYLRQAEGVRVYDASGFTACTGYRYLTVMLEADITLTSTDSTEHTGNGAMTLINLNGHTITSTAKDAFGQHRSGLKLIGEGTINHTGTGYFFYTKRHGSFEEYQYFYVGKGVTINTAGTLFETTSDMTLTEGFPKVRIDGTVKAAALIKLAGASNASVVIGKTADITVTSNTFINSSLANDNNHINVAIEGGNFTVPQTVVWCDDISKYTYSITGGSFNVAPNGILNSGYEAVYDEATQLYVIRKSGCPVYENGEHNFIMGDVIPGYSAANCINGGYHVFECACGETYEKRVEALGHNCTEVSVLPAPQYGVTDITRKDCTRCNYFYYVNPQDAYFTMVYAAADGSLVEVTDVVSKFYNVTVTQSDDRSVLKVTGIKNGRAHSRSYGFRAVYLGAIVGKHQTVNAESVSASHYRSEICGIAQRLCNEYPFGRGRQIAPLRIRAAKLARYLGNGNDPLGRFFLAYLIENRCADGNDLSSATLKLIAHATDIFRRSAVGLGVKKHLPDSNIRAHRLT